MWVVEYKPNKNSAAWVVLGTHDNKTTACFKAFQVSVNYFMVKVTEPDGSVFWSN